MLCIIKLQLDQQFKLVKAIWTSESGYTTKTYDSGEVHLNKISNSEELDVASMFYLSDSANDRTEQFSIDKYNAVMIEKEITVDWLAKTITCYFEDSNQAREFYQTLGQLGILPYSVCNNHNFLFINIRVFSLYHLVIFFRFCF